MDQAQKELQIYVDKASELADAVRYDIQHNKGQISEDTLVALNEFIIAANMVKDLTDIINDTKLN